MRILTLSIAMLGLVASSTPAHAEATATEILRSYADATDEGKRWLVGYMTGLVTGYGWANAALKAQGDTPLYCMPKGRELADEDVVSLVRGAIRNDPQLGLRPFGMTLMVALNRRFPCPKGGQKKPSP